MQTSLLTAYTEILETGEFSDVDILVGKEPNTKTFHLHALILKICSPYFHNLLSNKEKERERERDREIRKMKQQMIKQQMTEQQSKMKQQVTEQESNMKQNMTEQIVIKDISVRVFEILIKYIYSNKLELENNEFRTNVRLLIAADKLRLNDLSTFIEDYLLRNEELLKQNFVLIQSVTDYYFNFTKLSQFYKYAYQQDPSLIFKAKDFTRIDREVLLDILTKNNHNLKPIEVWDKLMDWAIAQTDKLPKKITEWTFDNVSTCGVLIKQFIPHIKFNEIPTFEFYQKIKPLKNIFDDKIYIKILENYSFNIMDINSKILDYELACMLAKFVGLNEDGNFARLFISNDVNLYKFKLLVRGSENGFDCRTFHERCDNKGPTITIAKVKNTNEILGGFNPYDWKFGVHSDKKSFIFSIDKVNPTFSNVNEGIILSTFVCCGGLPHSGPGFGSDLKLLCYNINRGQYRKNNYSSQIRQSEAEFEIEEYEVFQVYKNTN